IVYCVVTAHDGPLWAGTTAGLYKYDKLKDIFSLVDVEGSTFFWVAEDHDKKLWLNTPKGVVRFNPLNNESNLYSRNQGVDGKVLTNLGLVRRNGEILY